MGALELTVAVAAMPSGVTTAKATQAIKGVSHGQEIFISAGGLVSILRVVRL
jgi:hypothetical protein